MTILIFTEILFASSALKPERPQKSLPPASSSSSLDLFALAQSRGQSPLSPQSNQGTPGGHSPVDGLYSSRSAGNTSRGNSPLSISPYPQESKANSHA